MCVCVRFSMCMFLYVCFTHLFSQVLAVVSAELPSHPLLPPHTRVHVNILLIHIFQQVELAKEVLDTDANLKRLTITGTHEEAAKAEEMIFDLLSKWYIVCDIYIYNIYIYIYI